MLQLRTEMYYVYSGASKRSMGTRTLIVAGDYNQSASGTPVSSWAAAEEIFGGSYFDIFTTNWFRSNAEAFEPVVNIADEPIAYMGCKVNKHAVDYFESEGVVAIEYKILGDGEDERIIRVEYSRDVTYTPETNHMYNLAFKFILNGVTKCTVGGWVAQSYYGIGTASWYFQQSFMGIPWLFTDNGTEYVGGPSAYVQYHIRNTVTDQSTKYDGRINCYKTSNYQVAQFKEWLGVGTDDPYEPEPYDPYYNPFDPGGTTEPYGPGSPGYDPNFGEDSDNPQVDPLPDESTMGASATGFATLFTPSKTQLQNLSSLMWNKTFLEFIYNLVQDVSDLFVSLAMVPFVVPAGATKTVTWFGFETSVSLTLASKQFLEFPMGTINLGDDTRAYNSDSALDYSPFSELGIYLPFIGYRDLNIDECRKASISLTYRIDILSGECVAILRVAGKDLYTFTGNCLTQIPLSQSNMESLVTDAVNVGLAISGVNAASGVAAAESAAAGKVSSQEISDLKNAHAGAHMAHSEGMLASATANAMMGMKPHISKTGSVSGAAAMMAVRQPFLFLKTPRQAIPNNYNRFCGFPSNMTGPLSSFSGYTVVEDIRLNNLAATSAEVAEIYKLLKQGVII